MCAPFGVLMCLFANPILHWPNRRWDDGHNPEIGLFPFFSFFQFSHFSSASSSSSSISAPFLLSQLAPPPNSPGALKIPFTALIECRKGGRAQMKLRPQQFLLMIVPNNEGAKMVVCLLLKSSSLNALREFESRVKKSTLPLRILQQILFYIFLQKWTQKP